MTTRVANPTGTYYRTLRKLGLFEKRFDGDDSLLELARWRFGQAGLGAEMHAQMPDQLEHLLKFRPTASAPLIVHLPRDLNLAAESTSDRITQFASRFAGQIDGLVVHDDLSLAQSQEQFLQAAQHLDARLTSIAGSPIVFVEYAAGLEPEIFAGFFQRATHLKNISACIDTGHVGIRQVRQAYSRMHPNVDVCTLKTKPQDLPNLMPDIFAATSSALPCILELISVLGSVGKPLHFHLHDGHPLSSFSPFGVSDHLSFLAEIPLAFEFLGKRSAPLMYGPDGLRRIATAALKACAPDYVSFTFEIHPTFERQSLGEACRFFQHWIDKTNAEKMNHWLSTLALNQDVLTECSSVSPVPQ